MVRSLYVIPEMDSFSKSVSKKFCDQPLPKYLDSKTVLIYCPHPVLYSTLLHLPPLRSTVSEDAGIELSTVATLAWQSDARLDLIVSVLLLYVTAQDMIKTPCQYVPYFRTSILT